MWFSEMQPATLFLTNEEKSIFGIPKWEGEDALKKKFFEDWIFDDQSSKQKHLSLDCLVDILFRARIITYGQHPKMFERDIDRLISLNRLFFEREILLS